MSLGVSIAEEQLRLLGIVKPRRKRRKKMPRMPKVKMETSLVMGQLYQDKGTGYEGICVSIVFFDSGCIQAALERLDKDGKPEAYQFDERRLVPVDEVKEAGGGPVKASPRPQAQRS